MTLIVTQKHTQNIQTQLSFIWPIPDQNPLSLLLHIEVFPSTVHSFCTVEGQDN